MGARQVATNGLGRIAGLCLVAACFTLPSIHGQHDGHAASTTMSDNPISVNSTLPADLKAMTNYTFAVSFLNASATPSSISTSDFVIDHTKVLHMVVIGGDLDSFYHVHPEDFGYRNSSSNAALPLAVQFPFAGEYIAGFDGETERGALATSLHFRIMGAPIMRAAAAADFTNIRTVKEFMRDTSDGPLPWVSLAGLQGKADAGDGAIPQVVFSGDEFDVNFTRPASILAGEAFKFTIALFHASDGSPVTDMMPLWGAQAHVGVVKHDLSYIEHAHAMGTTAMDMSGMQMMESTFGPETGGELTLLEGMFRLVFQMSRGNNSFIFATFDVDVSGTAEQVVIANVSPPLPQYTVSAAGSSCSANVHILTGVIVAIYCLMFA